MIDQKFQNCIAACSACAVECLHCAHGDLNEQDISKFARCIKLNHDCAGACFLAMEALAGRSEFVKQICSLCAEICNACVEECEKHLDMHHCKKSADAARKCALACSAI